MLYNTFNDQQLELWEEALVTAKVCEVVGINPHDINFVNTTCNSSKKSIYLEKLKRTLHGKTI